MGYVMFTVWLTWSVTDALPEGHLSPQYISYIGHDIMFWNFWHDLKMKPSLYLMKFSLNNAYATGLSTSSINHVVFLQGWTISIKHSTLIVKRTKIFKYPYWNKYLFGLLCILLFLLNKTLGKIYLYLF